MILTHLPSPSRPVLQNFALDLFSSDVQSQRLIFARLTADYAAFIASIWTSLFPTGGTALNESTSIGHTDTQMPQPMQELVELSSTYCLIA